jgi:hypothetical protein
MAGETMTAVRAVEDAVEVKRALAAALRMADMDYIRQRYSVTNDFLEGRSEAELLALMDADGDVACRTHQAFALSEYESVQRKVLDALGERSSPFAALVLTRSAFPDIRRTAWLRFHSMMEDGVWFRGFLRELLA